MSRKHHHQRHQSPRLDMPSTDPAEVAAAEKACEAIGAACEEMVAAQSEQPSEPPREGSCGSVATVAAPRSVSLWSDVTVIQRGAQ